jgi:hypothetical protein
VVISPTNFAEWGTPLVPIIKSDGGIRICGDYKSTINRHIITERYPLPKVEELHYKLQGGQKFSKIDLKDAYNQIELSDCSKSLCTWSTHKGAYTVHKMPFGITPATNIFQRIVEGMFSTLKNVAVFVDDIIITGKNDNEHLENLRLVLDRLLEAGLKAKISKCAFLQDEIKYLGFLINKDGLKKVPKKVNEILKLQAPKTPSEVKQLTGIINYYARFIPNMAGIMPAMFGMKRA